MIKHVFGFFKFFLFVWFVALDNALLARRGSQRKWNVKNGE